MKMVWSLTIPSWQHLLIKRSEDQNLDATRHMVYVICFLYVVVPFAFLSIIIMFDSCSRPERYPELQEELTKWCKGEPTRINFFTVYGRVGRL